MVWILIFSLSHWAVETTSPLALRAGRYLLQQECKELSNAARRIKNNEARLFQGIGSAAA
jgi:hypothetical protein